MGKVSKNNRHKALSLSKGFTIVELLVVIVVIGILAAITIVSYTGISQRATDSSVISDLDNTAKKLKLHAIANNDDYPANLTSVDGGAIKFSPGNDTNYKYLPNNYTNPKTFRIEIKNGNSKYHITESTAPTPDITCPSGFIVVPGSTTYGTSDFCVMKYEAKNVGGIATSQASGTPWVNITRATAIAKSNSSCNGCHMVTEPEWLTIAQNVATVSDNWSGGAVGNGSIYIGHTDSSPGSVIEAANPNDGYSGTGQNSGNQKRTLKLSNDEIIWDLSGNAAEWSMATIKGTDAPGLATQTHFIYDMFPVEWNNPLLLMGGLADNVSPKYAIPIAQNWNGATGIGAVYTNKAFSYYGNQDLHFRRGGAFNGSADPNFVTQGVFHIRIDPDVNGASSADNGGFRVAK
ncbi:MAG: prepilin-type N-terminal cleavage/methylation domain-containing protein [Candidatus Saccharibacteria bacterium]